MLKSLALSAALVGLALPTLCPLARGQGAPPTVPATADNVETAHQQLATLQKMLDEKLISPPEYEAARAKVLESIGVAAPAPGAPAPVPPPALVPTPAPLPPPAPPTVTVLPSFAGRWSVRRTRVETTFGGKIIETMQPPMVWVVTIREGTVTVQREEELLHLGRHAEITLVPENVPAAQMTGNTLTFSIVQTDAGHEHVRTTTNTYVLPLGPTDRLAGTYGRDETVSDPHGAFKTHEGGNVELFRLPG